MVSESPVQITANAPKSAPILAPFGCRAYRLVIGEICRCAPGRQPLYAARVFRGPDGLPAPPRPPERL